MQAETQQPRDVPPGAIGPARPKETIMPNNNTPLATAEADLIVLVQREDGLRQRLAAADGTLLAVKAERRALLTESDNPPAAALTKGDKAVRDALDTRDALADAVAEIGSRIVDKLDHIVRLQDAEARERRAAALDAVAGKVDDAAKRIAKAAGEIAAARADLAAALTDDTACAYVPAVYDLPGYMIEPSLGLPFVLMPGSDYRQAFDVLPVDVVASRFAGHLIAAVLPSLGIADEAEAHGAHQGGAITCTLAPVATREATVALLSGPLRAVAASLRSGPEAQAEEQPRRDAVRPRQDGWTVKDILDEHGRPTGGFIEYPPDYPDAA